MIKKHVDVTQIDKTSRTLKDKGTQDWHMIMMSKNQKETEGKWIHQEKFPGTTEHNAFPLYN